MDKSTTCWKKYRSDISGLKTNTVLNAKKHDKVEQKTPVVSSLVIATFWNILLLSKNVQKFAISDHIL